jgi:hypothetical protein
LRNELYVGRLVWNRLRYTKDLATGRRVSRINPREDWICRDVPDLRILEDNLWSGVQTRLGAIRNSESIAKARATKFWTRRRPQHLLTGKAVCGVCGGPAAPIGKDYIACSLLDGKAPVPTAQAFVATKSRDGLSKLSDVS